jgi:hypothetical protein
VHRVGVRQDRGDEGVARLVVGGELLLLLAKMCERRSGPMITFSIERMRSNWETLVRFSRAARMAASFISE